MRRLTVSLIGAAFFVSSAQADYPAETPFKAPSIAPEIPSRIDFDYLEQRVAALMNEDQMVGFAIAVIDKGEIAYLKGHGRTYPGGPAVNEDTVFRWASLSKGMAGTVAGVLEAQQKLELSAPLANFKTTLRLPKSGLQKLDVSDLLSHQLGIVPNAYDTRLEDGVDPKTIRKSLGKLDYICTPGDCHSYQNVAFDAISEITEKVTGKDYKKLVSELVLEPLDMTSASLTKEELIASGNYARPFGYARGLSLVRPVELNENYYRVPAAGGMNSSIRDLAKYMRAHMGLENDVLPENVLKTIHSPRAPTWKERNRMRRQSEHVSHAEYALGWRVYDYAGRTLIGHRGAVMGYRAMILFDPELDTGIAAMWNSSTNKPVGLQFELMDMAYGLERKKWMKLASDDEPVSSRGSD